MPIQWIGLLGILIFAVWLKALPTVGMTSSTYESGLTYYADVLKHMFLPATMAGLWYVAQFVLYVRASMLNVLSQDYITAAMAKGLPSRMIYLTHALRNALLPVITLVGLQVGYLLTGLVVLETLFGWPGVGNLLYLSMEARDYPTILGIFLFVGISVLVGNLIADLAYAFVDPRIRYQRI